MCQQNAAGQNLRATCLTGNLFPLHTNLTTALRQLSDSLVDINRMIKSEILHTPVDAEVVDVWIWKT